MVGRCVLLVAGDGDDWLFSDNVLTILNNEYTNNDLNITYGSARLFATGKLGDRMNKHGAKKFPDNIKKNNQYRKYCHHIAGHLRTCKAKLLKSRL